MNPTMESDCLVAGVDEVGRGCIAGPVIAAAVILGKNFEVHGLADSKKLSVRQREAQASRIRHEALDWSVGRAEVEEIDEINILQASLLAMRRAVSSLRYSPALCLVDGNRDPALAMATRLIVGGDDLEPAIQAASIVAKVARDAEMIVLDQQYPEYGLAAHKGYGTARHRQALFKFGPSPIHRMSFAPCAASLHRGETS